jgi:dTDP-4-dehydrorhamnose reductase
VTSWLVVGAAGMLGRDVVEALAGRQVTAAARSVLDVTDPTAVARAVAGHDVVVNCAAWTAVDDAEGREGQAFAVNAAGAANLARACRVSRAHLLQVSTDYVFGGASATPQAEGDPVAPRTAYGRTKAAGEWAVRAELPERHWILRTAWLYGAHGPSFVRTMLRLERERPTVEVVDDQRGQPTWTRDLAQRIVAVVDAGAPPGTYHATNAGDTTWCGLARRVFALVGADPARVRATTSDAFVRAAPRPAYSVLDDAGWARAGLAPLRPWDQALAAALPALRAVVDR